MINISLSNNVNLAYISTVLEMHIQQADNSKTFMKTLRIFTYNEPHKTVQFSGLTQLIDLFHTCLIMAERRFTIRDMLNDLNIELNIPPFMEGCPSRNVEKVGKLLFYGYMLNKQLEGLKHLRYADQHYL